MTTDTMLLLLLDGALVSLKIFALTFVMSLPLGLLVALCRMSGNFFLRNITKIYISIMRGTPLMLQLFIVYFGPYLIFKQSISTNYEFPAVIIAFVVNYAAYFAEIFRSGIESVPTGQAEAAKILGFNKIQTFVLIILPQVIKRVLPSVTNEVITLVKDTSLAFTIGCIEMFTVSKRIAAAETNMLPYLFAAIIYYVFNYLVAFIMERMEKKLSYYEIK